MQNEVTESESTVRHVESDVKLEFGKVEVNIIMYSPKKTERLCATSIYVVNAECGYALRSG